MTTTLTGAPPTRDLALALPRAPLAAALALVSIGTKKSTLPILGAVRLAVTDGWLTFVTTDLEQVVETRLPVVGVPDSAPVALPAKRLADVVSHLPASAEVRLATSGLRATVSAGRARFELNGLPADEFPTPPPITSVVSATLPARALLVGLRRAATHTSHEDSRPTINGVLVEATDDGVRIVGTDGGHLYCARMPDAGTLRGEWILPRPVITSITRLFEDEETLRLEADDRGARLVGSMSTLSFRLIEGPYPNFRQLLRFETPHVATVNRAALIAAVKGVAAMSDALRLEANVSAGELALSIDHEDAGRAEDVVPCQFASAGERFRFAVNRELLVASLEVTTGTDVVLQLSAPERAFFIRDAAAPTGETCALVMPLRLEMPAQKPARKAS